MQASAKPPHVDTQTSERYVRIYLFRRQKRTEQWQAATAKYVVHLCVCQPASTAIAEIPSSRFMLLAVTSRTSHCLLIVLNVVIRSYYYFVDKQLAIHSQNSRADWHCSMRLAVQRRVYSCLAACGVGLQLRPCGSRLHSVYIARFTGALRVRINRICKQANGGPAKPYRRQFNVVAGQSRLKPRGTNTILHLGNFLLPAADAAPGSGRMNSGAHRLPIKKGMRRNRGTSVGKVSGRVLLYVHAQPMLFTLQRRTRVAFL